MGREWIWAHIRHLPFATLAAIGVLVIVAFLVGAAVAWQRGLDRAAQAGADSSLLYLVARGSEDAVERSLIEEGQYDQAIGSLPGVAIGQELVHMSPVIASNGNQSRLTWRGVSPEITTVRQGLQLSSGQWFNGEASKEVVIGQRVASELGIGVGEEVSLLGTPLKVVGIFDHGVGFAAGEIWLPLAMLQGLSNRHHISKLVVRNAFEPATFLMLSRPDLGMVEISEEAYLATVSRGLAPLRVVGWIIAVLLICAAAVGAGSAAVALADARRGSFAIARSVGVSVGRLILWFCCEACLRGLIAILIALFVLMAVDGTVLRLGTIAPELRADRVVLVATIFAVIVSTFLTVLPTLLNLTRLSLSQQLRSQ